MTTLLPEFSRRLLPPYTGPDLTLYRGEVEVRHEKGAYGISWTPHWSKASAFAHGRWMEEGLAGVVLKVEASANMIVVEANAHSEFALGLDEDEYILDPRLIHDKASVAYEPKRDS